MRSALHSLSWVLACGLAAACGGGAGSSSESSSTASSGAAGVGGNATGAGGDSAASGLLATSSTATGNVVMCDSAKDEDRDGDGFTGEQGDCNDCDANVNPAAVDVPTERDASGNLLAQVDEDCSGVPDDNIVCDEKDVFIHETDPKKAARVIDICKEAVGPSWGLVSSKYVRANGADSTPGKQTGLVDSFGSQLKPRWGGHMLALSTGRARDRKSVV